MAPKKCTACSGSFPGHSFVGLSVVCRLCLTRQHLETRLKEQDEKREADRTKILELSRTVASLQEFIQANVAVVPNPSPIVPLITAVPSTPADNTTQGEDGSSTVHDGFTVVSGGAKPARQAIYPTHCFNRFAILEEDDEQESTFLVGDSMIRQQVVEFCGRVPRRRRNYCYPGAGIDDIATAFEEISPLATNDSLFVIHTGTNDLCSVRSEELLEKYRRLIQQYKTKSNNILISGVLPRISAASDFYSKAFSLNNRLGNICREMDVGYINCWDQFYGMRSLFQKDGLHLSGVGAARFGRLLHGAVQDLRAKNESRVQAPST